MIDRLSNLTQEEYKKLEKIVLEEENKKWNQNTEPK
jgi:hypothetical protein